MARRKRQVSRSRCLHSLLEGPGLGVGLRKSLLGWRYLHRCLQLAFSSLVLQASVLRFAQTVQGQWQLVESQKCQTEVCYCTPAKSRGEAQEEVPAPHEKGKVEDQDHPRRRKVPSMPDRAALLW